MKREVVRQNEISTYKTIRDYDDMYNWYHDFWSVWDDLEDDEKVFMVEALGYTLFTEDEKYFLKHDNKDSIESTTYDSLDDVLYGLNGEFNEYLDNYKGI